MDRIQMGEKRFSLEGENIEIKQIIAIELGFILATSESPIYPDMNRLRKLIYVRDILLLEGITLNYQIFDYITDEELDGLTKVLEENFIIPDKLKAISKFDIYLWKARTLQPFNVYDFYKGVKMPDELKCIDIVRTEEILLGHYLLYINNLKKDEVNYNLILKLDIKIRIYKILNWFAYNNYFTTYGELFYKASENLISRIEAICLMSCKDFKATGIFSVIRYFILLQNPSELYIFKSILEFKTREFYKQKISRANRRRILSEINRLCEEDFEGRIQIHPKYKPYIKSLDKRLHPKDYKDIFPKAYEFFLHFRTKSKPGYKDVVNHEISKLYKKDKEITEIASLVYERFGSSVFVNRFDSFARRAELIGKETDILELLIDTKLDSNSINQLEDFYRRRLNKIKTKEKVENILPFFIKPSANIDFINCVLDVLNIKRNE